MKRLDTVVSSKLTEWLLTLSGGSYDKCYLWDAMWGITRLEKDMDSLPIGLFTVLAKMGYIKKYN